MCSKIGGGPSASPSAEIRPESGESATVTDNVRAVSICCSHRCEGGLMSTTTRVPKANIPYAAITGVFGDLAVVPEPFEVMWHNPAVLSSMTAFGSKVQEWNQLDENLKSFAHMAVDALVGCSWCLDINYFQAHNAGLDEVKASEVP